MSILKSPKLFKTLMPLWPPLLGTGIKIDYIASDYKKIIVSMRLRWYNKNYVGTHFGGSLFTMTDPFFMLMLTKILKGEYYVWDKAGYIDFIKPGRSEVKATFELTETLLSEILDKTASGEKFIKDIEVNIFDTSEELIAKVTRTLYVRKKPSIR